MYSHLIMMLPIIKCNLGTAASQEPDTEAMEKT